MADTNTKSARKRGRKPDAGSKSGQIRELLKTGMSAGDIAKKLGCTPALVYNVKARVSNGPASPKRGPGRPPKAKAAVSASLDGIAGIVAAVQSSERQRTQMRAVLERIQALVADALS